MPIFHEIFEKNEVNLDRIGRYLMVLNGWKLCHMIDNKDSKCETPGFYSLGGL